MRLYIRPIAPNALKVLIFMVERGIAVETVDVGELSPENYARVSPLRTVPVLVTDDGLSITESLTICQYLDASTPGPSLFGEGLEERAVVAMWERRAELGLMNPAIEFGHHTQAMFAGRLEQFPDWARAHVGQCSKLLDLMEARLGESRFLAGERFTMADLTAFLGGAGRVAGDRASAGAGARALARRGGGPAEHGAAPGARGAVRAAVGLGRSPSRCSEDRAQAPGDQAASRATGSRPRFEA